MKIYCLLIFNNSILNNPSLIEKESTHTNFLKGATMQHTHQSKIVLLMLIFFFLTILACTGKDGGKVELKSEDDKVSYTIGIQLGENFKQQGIDINPDILSSAINDVLAGTPLQLTDDEMTAVMQDFQTKMVAQQQKQASDNIVAASAFLADNAQKPGITTLPDSLQYEVITEGTGVKPKTTDTVKVNYHGTLLDGTVFDRSVERGEPIEFPLSGVIPGWTEVLQLMKTGAKWKVFIPPNLAYGAGGRPGIPPNALLTFEMELLEIVENQ